VTNLELLCVEMMKMKVGAELHFSYWKITSLMRYEICFLLRHRRFHVADENFALEKLQRFLKSQDVWNPFTILQKTVTFPVVILGILWAIPILELFHHSLVFAQWAREHTQVVQVFLVFARGAKEHTKSYKSFLSSNEELRSNLRLTRLSCLRTRS
jgi:hypothetical protein